MKQNRFVLVSVLLGALVLLIACDTGPQAVDSQDEPVVDSSTLVNRLEGAGATVEPGGRVTQPFFTPQGQILAVNGQDVQVFEFDSVSDADGAASTVAPDGSSVGTSIMTWISRPHFYKSGNLIVLYVGDETATIDILVDVLGPQFAGG